MVRRHVRSGIVDNLAADEHDALAQIRRFLSYLPSNVWQRTPRYVNHDPVERQEQALLDAVPRDSNTGFDMRAIVKLIVDQDSFFEIGEFYGPSQICGLATLAGQPVGILANDCLHYAGAMIRGGAKVSTICRNVRHLSCAGGEFCRPTRIHDWTGVRAGRYHSLWQWPRRRKRPFPGQ